jgi:hypothetical protein
MATDSRRSAASLSCPRYPSADSFSVHPATGPVWVCRQAFEYRVVGFVVSLGFLRIGLLAEKGEGRLAIGH